MTIRPRISPTTPIGPPLLHSPCTKKGLAKHPPLDGRTSLSPVAGVEGTHCSDGDGVRGVSYEGNGVRGRGVNGVVGDGFQDGRGVLGFSKVGEGVRGETESTHLSAVVGISKSTRRGGGLTAGVFGASETGEGVHGESRSPNFAAVAGIAGYRKRDDGESDEDLPSPGVWGGSEHGIGVYGQTNSSFHAAVAGKSLFTPPPDRAGEKFAAPGLWGSSEVGHGVYAESWSPHFAAVAGVQRNGDRQSFGAGIYGEHQGNGPAGYFKGKVFVTDDIELVNADCAEDFDIAGEAVAEPGTVMTFDAEGALRPSMKAYDCAVAGIVSGAGNLKPAIVLDKQVDTERRRVPIALIGKVYCKVDASLGPIAVGDLLTTSSTPGHAMKAEDRTLSFGAVIGKALRPLAGGTGLIPVLVASQ